MESFTPTCSQTPHSIPFLPSSTSLGLLRSALKTSSTTLLQTKDTNSPSSTPVKFGAVAFPTIRTTSDTQEACNAETPLNASPAKTLRFDQEVDVRENERRMGKDSNRKSLNNEDEDVEEWVSESEDGDVEEAAPELLHARTGESAVSREIEILSF